MDLCRCEAEGPKLEPTKGREERWGSQTPTRGFRAYKALCLAFMAKCKLCKVVTPSKKVPDLKCELQDLFLEIVDLKREVPDLTSGGIPLNLTPARETCKKHKS